MNNKKSFTELQSETMEGLKSGLSMTLYDFLSGEKPCDLKALEDYCLNNERLLDTSIIYGSEVRIRNLLLCIRRIYARTLHNRDLPDPYYPASSASSNTCSIL